MALLCRTIFIYMSICSILWNLGCTYPLNLMCPAPNDAIWGPVNMPASMSDHGRNDMQRCSSYQSTYSDELGIWLTITTIITIGGGHCLIKGAAGLILIGLLRSHPESSSLHRSTCSPATQRAMLPEHGALQAISRKQLLIAPSGRP